MLRLHQTLDQLNYLLSKKLLPRQLSHSKNRLLQERLRLKKMQPKKRRPS